MLSGMDKAVYIGVIIPVICKYKKIQAKNFLINIRKEVIIPILSIIYLDIN